MPDPVTEIFRPVPQYCDAQIDTINGVLICSSTAAETLPQPLGKGVYHTFDYPFYYFNLQANAANRIAMFLSKQ